MTRGYHTSVLLHECIEGLAIHPDGTYVDLTFGGGGHSRAILERLSESGRLIAFDQDENALANRWDDSRLEVYHSNFSEAYEYLLAIGVTSVDGVLADLGVSSFQLDNDESGFSYRDHIDLDMRMNKNSEMTAADILNSYSVEQLQQVFQDYGEVRNAKSLAQRITEARCIKPLLKSEDLNEILNQIKFGTFPSYAAPIYQALRMEVNRELDVLKQMMESITLMIKPKGRLAMITFHSLEDRLVKNYMKYGEFTDQPTSDIYGRRKKWDWKLITKKPITPSEEEQKINPRSRSAKLRILEKI